MIREKIDLALSIAVSHGTPTIPLQAKFLHLGDGFNRIIQGDQLETIIVCDKPPNIETNEDDMSNGYGIK